MFGIGLPEMIVIMAVALIVVGPDKLPELARSLAKGIGELKKTMNQVKENLSEESKVISSVQEDLQKTAGQLKTNLLEGDDNNWTGEENTAQQQTVEEADVIDLQPLEDRPWEKDANEGPDEQNKAEDNSSTSAEGGTKDTPPSPAA